MNVISKAGLMKLASRHPAAIEEVGTWFRRARRAKWTKFADIRADFASVDQVGAVLIFNVQGNSLRLIVRVNYTYRTLHVKALLTHKEYDRKEWMKWAP